MDQTSRELLRERRAADELLIEAIFGSSVRRDDERPALMVSADPVAITEAKRARPTVA